MATLLPQWQQINTHLLPQWQQINTQLLPQQQQINTLAPASSVPHGCCSVEQLGAISYTVTTSFTIPVVVAQLRRPLPPIYPPLINLPSPVVMSNPPRGTLVEKTCFSPFWLPPSSSVVWLLEPAGFWDNNRGAMSSARRPATRSTDASDSLIGPAPSSAILVCLLSLPTLRRYGCTTLAVS